MSWKIRAFNILIVAISLWLVAYLLSIVNLADFVRTFASINPLYALAGFAFYVLSSLLKSFRFSVLLHGRFGAKRLFSLVLVHNFANLVLPARSGEVSYIYLLRKIHSVRTAEGIATLLVSRILDFIALTAFLYLTLIGLGEFRDMLYGSFLALLALVSAILILLLALAFLGKRALRLMEMFFERTGTGETRVAKYALRKSSETLDAMKGIGIRKNLPALAILTAAIWSTLFLANLFAIKALGMDLGVFQLTMVVFVASILPLLPIYGAGGFGTTEAVLSVILISFGVSKDMSIAVSFGMHILIIAFTTVLGIAGMAAIGRKSASGLWGKKGKGSADDSPA